VEENTETLKTDRFLYQLKAEQNRNRRAMLWLVAVFVFVLLIILSFALSSGLYVLKQAEQLGDTIDQVNGQSATLSLRIEGLTDRLTTLESTQLKIIDKVSGGLTEQKRDVEALRTDVQRVNRWLNAVDLAANKTELDQLQVLVDGLGDNVRGVQSQMERTQLTTLASLKQRVAEAVALATAPELIVSDKPVDTEIDGHTRQEIEAQFAEAMQQLEAPPAEKPLPAEISVVKLPNGNQYEGELKGGLFSGSGILTTPRGDRYEGQFANDLRSGYGTYESGEGERYHGEWRQDLRHGRGTLLRTDGSRYIGDMRDDLITGVGFMVYADGNQYLGEFRNGERTGRGIIRYFNGDSYEGDSIDSIRSGFGIYMFADGARYIGEFANDLRDGDGRYIYPGGEEYVGPFVAGKKHGIGTRIYPNGSRVKGLWKDDKHIRDVSE
jgi:hypothetical protein